MKPTLSSVRDGGDGSVSFNREKYKPRGGPDGGRGGDGGDVILISTEDLSTLEPHAYRNVVKAGRGGHGSSNNKAGERGKDAVLDVPVGTQVFDEDGLLADLSKPKESFVVAGGGEGGRGNGSFATSTRQAPAFREKGLPGEEREIRLELKVLSDVGLVGLPNAGKSSLLRTLSAARPRVGDYPLPPSRPSSGSLTREPIANGSWWLTSLASSLGPARAGASVIAFSDTWRGRGYLRSCSMPAKTRKGPRHAAGRASRGQALGEAHGRGAEQGRPPRRRAQGVPAGGLSGCLSGLRDHGEGVAALRDNFEERLREMGEERPAPGVAEREHRIFRPTWKGVRVEHENGRYVVSGESVERLALKTDWGNREGVERFQHELQRIGVLGALRRAGAEPGDEVRIGDTVFDFQ